MTRHPITRSLTGIGWCLLVPLAALILYLALGLGAAAVLDKPILATIALDGLTALVIALVRWRRPEWLTYPARDKPAVPPRSFALQIAAMTALAFLAGQALAIWLYRMGGSAGFDHSTQMRQDAGVAITAVLTLLAAPVAEEMLFRGLIYPLLRRRVGVLVSVLVSTTAFALLHGNVVQFASALPLAILLALVYERSRKLWPCILIHLGFNLAATFVPAVVMAALAGPITTLLLTTAFLGGALMLYRGITTASVTTPVDSTAPR